MFEYDVSLVVNAGAYNTFFISSQRMLKTNYVHLIEEGNMLILI